MIRGYKGFPIDAPPPPQITMVSDCKSEVCKARLHAVLAEVKKANQAIRSPLIWIEEERMAAARHILHLKALRKYQTDNKKNALSATDVEHIFEEGIVLENPDAEMEDNPIAGPSNQSFTSQSLSYAGFTDSDSDYVP